MNTRGLAAQLLQNVLANHQSLTEVLRSPKLQTLAARDQGLVRDLCFGCMRWHERLSAILAVLMTKPLKAADNDIECVLRIGLYQILYQQIPEHAAVSEAVNATRDLKKQWAGKLVNGVLRTFLRERERILAQVDTKPNVRYAFPNWLLTRLQNAYAQDWERLVQAINEHPPFTIRVNQLQFTTEHYQQLLTEAGIPAVRVEGVPSALVITQPVPVTNLPYFAEGAVSVQDAAAQLAALLLAPQAGETILDACAAPGGKTGHLLESAPNLTVLALDSSAKRLEQVSANLARLKLTAQIKAADAGDVESWWEGQLFDRILLDAPCSATGVIRRHPDIKYLRKNSDIASLQLEQARLLKALWQTLKKGGVLLYATCSLLPQENQEQIQTFLAATPEAQLEPLPLNNLGEGKIGRQLLPSYQGMDGFYYALLRKA
ncbi:16S rRNA (cytosine(967)-C(5))-methyltransferase RsmB [Thiofilum flexile]|uniref:16S rRNA (cytosine(967)-C(5))-methyltransferase RsmB n=1 Tax=Thiofilum flexile TaxID=125627 RepID=UPI0003655E26|nr:16S rRNA (cytosine(967)-C(5))-methyltransferase RsmB [Thiofilum flexile]